MKSPPSLSLADHRLLDLVWSSEPISSPQLCKLAQAQLGWKRTTTYTVIKRLCDKGCLKNEAAVVTSLAVSYTHLLVSYTCPGYRCMSH